MQTALPACHSKPGETTWRLFVALKLPEEIRATLMQVQRELRSLMSPGDASFPRTVHLHLTLRFLGDVDCWRIEDLKTSLLKRVGMVGRFELRCERLECFPNLRRPKVVWAWVHDEQEQLAALQRIVVIATETFTQQPKENQFIGHVTLARLKRIRRAEVERIASFVEGAVHRQFGSWAANEVELVRSELSPQGSRYTVLAEVPLV
jgi:2'-5' RNA ligase